jgi:hypothetical protein
VALVIVMLGIIPGAGYLHWRAPEVRAEIDRRLAEAPTDPAGRLDAWMRFAVPQIQTRLTLLRFSGEHPWLVTQTVLRDDGEPEIWGLDLTSPSPAEVVREDLRIELHLPAPRLLGRGQLRGDNAEHVPVYPAGSAPPDPALRAEELLHWFLAGTIKALPADIPGAELALVIGPRGEQR